MFTLGIIEIVGEPGTGKTNFILSHIKERNTIYITNSIINRNLYTLSHLWIKKLNTFLELKGFILLELDKIVKKEQLKVVIIDSLDKFLYTEENPRNFSKDLVKMVQCLRNCVFKYKICVIIVNNKFKRLVENFEHYNKYLGYNWLYTANKTFTCKKISKEEFHCVDTNNNVICKYKVMGFGEIFLYK